MMFEPFEISRRMFLADLAPRHQVVILKSRVPFHVSHIFGMRPQPIRCDFRYAREESFDWIDGLLLWLSSELRLLANRLALQRISPFYLLQTSTQCILC